MKPTSHSSSLPKKNARKSAGIQANSSLSAVDPGLRHQMIATTAYYRAERRGFNGGDPSIDWHEAEMEIERTLQGSAEVDEDKDIVRLETLLTEWDVQFRELNDKVVKAKAQTRAEYQKQLQTIADKRVAISDKLKDLRRHTGEAWNDLKSAIENTWDDMRHEIELVASRFMQEAPPVAGKKKRKPQ